ncbi:MAG: hypothetical protein M3Z75_24700 [Actinomycetota bacterium]|nr:hypothetical protein [Actinomycetota bacterium]
MKWTEWWIARAQRKGDLRAERLLQHEESVRAGMEPPSFRERMESLGTLNRGPLTRRYVNSDWPLDARPDDASLRLANAWLTWVGPGPICGPDGVEVTVWVRSAGQDLPFHDTPGDQAWLTRAELPASRNGYTVCIRRLPAGPTQAIRSFAIETSARWYAVGLAKQVREVGITALRPADIPLRPLPTAGLEEILLDGIVGLSVHLGRGLLWLPQRARGGWRRVRTGRRRL